VVVFLFEPSDHEEIGEIGADKAVLNWKEVFANLEWLGPKG
jgi:hypothetical protein